jgi:bifunctional DNA-binding transcriptional regulator/antitoxin component of YhaV-PrlF toxin-antitoxin module
MKTVVVMDGRGQLTMPEPIREALRVEDGDGLEQEVEYVDHEVILRQTDAIPEEDLWAYTPEHIEQVNRARREGRGLRMSEADLLRFIGE